MSIQPSRPLDGHKLFKLSLFLLHNNFRPGRAPVHTPGKTEFKSWKARKTRGCHKPDEAWHPLHASLQQPHQTSEGAPTRPVRVRINLHTFQSVLSRLCASRPRHHSTSQTLPKRHAVGQQTSSETSWPLMISSTMPSVMFSWRKNWTTSTISTMASGMRTQCAAAPQANLHDCVHEKVELLHSALLHPLIDFVHGQRHGCVGKDALLVVPKSEVLATSTVTCSAIDSGMRSRRMSYTTSTISSQFCKTNTPPRFPVVLCLRWASSFSFRVLSTTFFCTVSRRSH